LKGVETRFRSEGRSRANRNQTCDQKTFHSGLSMSCESSVRVAHRKTSDLNQLWLC
jgi:hypothetical protein